MTEKEIRSQVIKILYALSGIDNSEITDADDLYNFIDSVDIVHFVMDLEKHFKMHPNKIDEARPITIDKIVKTIVNEQAQEQQKAKLKRFYMESVQQHPTNNYTGKNPYIVQRKDLIYPQIILTNMPNGNDEKPTTLNLGRISGLSKHKFLDCISKYDPKENDGNHISCAFNVYSDQGAIRMAPFDTPKKWQPFDQKNGDNELVIEMIPYCKKACSAWANYQCPMCLASGECKSPFIKKYIGEVLFPERYGKQR